jgi:hypothetical protein
MGKNSVGKGFGRKCVSEFPNLATDKYRACSTFGVECWLCHDSKFFAELATLIALITLFVEKQGEA